MEAQYLAIDGSTVSVEAEAELDAPVTGTGWAVVPSLMQAHPFSVYPTGHSKVMENAVRESFSDLDLGSGEELSLKGGTLRIGEVEVPREGGGRRLTVAAWEGRGGCMTTSLPGRERDRLVEAFDTLQFSDSERGLAIDSPMVLWPRPPELIQEVPDLGIMAVRPAVASELERIPRAEGRRTRGGELFRVRSDSDAMLLLGRSAVVRIQPREGASLERVSEVVEGLRVDWTPRATPRPPR